MAVMLRLRWHHDGGRGRGAVAAVDDHHGGDHGEHEDDPGDRRDRTPALIDRRKQVIAVGVDVVDGVLGVVLDIAIQVICGADDADVIDVARSRQGARVRVSGHDLPTGRLPASSTGCSRRRRRIARYSRSARSHAGRPLACMSESRLPRNGKGPTWRSRSVSRTARASWSSPARKRPARSRNAVTAALGTDSGVLGLTDDKGRRFLVNAAKIAYVEIGVADARRVGFGIGAARLRPGKRHV